MRERFARLLAVSIGLYLGLSAPAEADYIYTYTGNNFTSITGSIPLFTTSDHVTITMDLSGPVDTNLNMSVPSGLVALTTAVVPGESFGRVSLTIPPFAPNETDTLLLTTDALGNITHWNVSIQTTFALYEGAGSYPSSTGSVIDQGFFGGSFGYSSAFSYTPGTWTLTITPEPSTGLLVMGGVLGLAATRHRRT